MVLFFLEFMDFNVNDVAFESLMLDLVKVFELNCDFSNISKENTCYAKGVNIDYLITLSNEGEVRLNLCEYKIYKH